jgi:hypothetical protein
LESRHPRDEYDGRAENDACPSANVLEMPKPCRLHLKVSNLLSNLHNGSGWDIVSRLERSQGLDCGKDNEFDEDEAGANLLDDAEEGDVDDTFGDFSSLSGFESNASFKHGVDIAMLPKLPEKI